MLGKISFCLFAILSLNTQYAFSNTGWEMTSTGKFIHLNPNFGELSQSEIQERLAKTQQTDIRFHLYKALLILQLHSYQANNGELETLASAIHIAATDASKRNHIIGQLGEVEKEIFISYDSLISLTHKLALNELDRNITYHFLSSFDVEAIQLAEPLQLYFLQILELEEALNFHVLGAQALIREQTALLTTILLILEKETTAMQLKRVIRDKADLTLDYKELNFYWTTLVNLCHEFLTYVDTRWGQCEYNRIKILNLVFGWRFTFDFPYCEKVMNPIEQFLPFVLKHADLQFVEERFEQMSTNLSSWDRNFAWVALHIKAVDHLLSSDLEKAKIYLEKAKTLTNDTLWCYFFSFDRAHWNQRHEEALKMIEYRSSLIR